MKIYIKYLNNKILVNSKKYESVNSIINSLITENKNIIKNENFNDFLLDYDGKNLNKNFSLEKYEIKEESILTLYPKLKGGNSFFSFAYHHPFLVFFSFIIVLIPKIN